MTQVPERDIVVPAQDEKLVHQLYEEYQQKNQSWHDQARAEIARDYNISEEEAEVHPEMEDRFNNIRNAVAENNGGLTSVDPTTGESGRRVAPPPAVAPVPAPVPPVQYQEYITSADVAVLENIVKTNGYKVVQSASDYTQGIITLVITR